MNLPDLREEALPRRVIETITEKATESENILWQDFTHSKEQLLVEFVTIDEKSKKILFSTSEDPNEVFNPALPIYFYEIAKECVFKTKILKMEKTYIEVALPTEILTLENRLFTRTIPQNGEEVSFTIMSDKETPQFSKKVLDYSEQGLAFTIIGREYLHFYEGDKLQFDLNNRDIPLPAEVGTIVYSTKVDEREVKDKMTYRVGIRFS